MLDKDKTQGTEKFENIRLYPSCSGGLISCQYNLKIIIETNTLFSTNEEINIPIDFYSPFNDKVDGGNKNDNNIKINNEEIINENTNENLNINQRVFIIENNSSDSDGTFQNNNNLNQDFQILKPNDKEDE